MKTYRVGVVGLGRMGSTLGMSVAQAAADSGRLELAAGADILPHRREEFAAKWGVDALYEDYREMIDQEKLDLVAVCTTATGVQKPGRRAPSTDFTGDLHSEMSVAVAEAGVPMLFVEKAMACSPRGADAILAACHRSGTVLNTGVLMRFDDRFAAVRDLIACGAIGEPTHAVAYTESNTLMHMHIHSLDTISYLIGDPGVVAVRGELYPRDLRVEGNRLEEDPNAAYHVRFADGVEAWSIPAGPRDFEIIGTRGMVRATKSAERVSRWEIRASDGGRGEWFEVEAPAGTGKDVPTQGGDGADETRLPTGACLEDLVDAYESGRPSRACLEDLVDAYESGRPSRGNVDVTHNITEACLAVADSHARGGGWVDLPMENRDLYLFHV